MPVQKQIQGYHGLPSLLDLFPIPCHLFPYSYPQIYQHKYSFKSLDPQAPKS